MCVCYFYPFQFASFELITKYVWLLLPKYITTDLKHFTHFVCGSFSGCLATVAAQPFDVIRTRFIAQGEPKVVGVIFIQHYSYN